MHTFVGNITHVCFLAATSTYEINFALLSFSDTLPTPLTRKTAPALHVGQVFWANTFGFQSTLGYGSKPTIGYRQYSQ